MVLSGDGLSARFEQLTAWLGAHQRLWSPHAFRYPILPWESEYPALAGALRTLPVAHAQRLVIDDAALASWLQVFLPAAAQALPLCEMAPLGGGQTISASATPADIPGRKWQQIDAFIQSFYPANLPALEWCAGKAHLGRCFAKHSGCSVEALEHNTALIEAGRQLAAREQSPVTFHEVDVLAAAAAQWVRRDQQVLALHACGTLHVQLLHYCAQRKPLLLHLAPCCYHLIEDTHYLALSQQGRFCALQLTREDLRTAVRDSVTSPARVQKRRWQLQAWRLGFDALQRQVRGVDEYLPTPSLPPTSLVLGFPALCQRLAHSGSITLPAAVDYTYFEALGERRLQTVTALDLPRILFRRALECWLILDRALYLREAGYTVEVGLFCSANVTPRNIMIRARRD